MPPTWDAFLAFAHRFKERAPLLVPVAVADLAGIVFGYYYYTETGQFDVAHPACGPRANPSCQPLPWWPLVADSPNAVLLVLAAFLAYRMVGWRSKVLDALAFVLNVYVGLWTTVLFLSYSGQMGTFRWGSSNSILFVTHMGMPLQAMVLLRDMRTDVFPRRTVLLVLAFLALFVYVDYWGPHLHPAPQLHDGPADEVVGLPGDRWLAVVSPALMAVAVLAWLALARPLRRATTRGPAGTA